MPIPGLLPGARRVRIPTIHREIPYDYIIFKKDNIIKAFNTEIKEIEFQNPDPVNVFQAIHNKYPVDTKSINLYIKAGDYISNNRLQIKNNRMRFFWRRNSSF